jgi:hypothetical protein
MNLFAAIVGNGGEGPGCGTMGGLARLKTRAVVEPSPGSTSDLDSGGRKALKPCISSGCPSNNVETR